MNATPDDTRYELLTAYLDGELSAEEVQQVESWLDRDAEARRLCAELRETSRLVASLPRRGAPASISEDVLRQLERSALLGEPSTAPMRTGRFRFLRTVTSMAAVFGVVVVAGWYIAHDRGLMPGDDRSNAPSLAQKQESEPTGSQPTGRERLAMARRSNAPPRTESSVERSSREREQPVAETADPDSNAKSLQQDSLADRRGRRANSDDVTKSGLTDSMTTARGDVASERGKHRRIDTADQQDFGDAIVLTVTVASRQAGADLLKSLADRFESDDESPTDQVQSFRVAASSLPGMIDRIDERDAEAELELRAGPLSVQGRGRVRAMVGAIAQTPLGSEQTASVTESKVALAPISSFHAAIGDLLNVLGVRPPSDPAPKDVQTATAMASKSPDDSHSSITGPPAPDDTVVSTLDVTPEANRPAPLLSETTMEDDAPANETKETVVADAPTEADDEGTLVDRQMRRLTDADAAPAEETATAVGEESDSTIEGLANRPVELGQSLEPYEGGAKETESVASAASLPSMSSSTPPSEELIRVIVRIVVESSDPNEGAQKATPAGGSDTPRPRPDASVPPSRRPEKPRANQSSSKDRRGKPGATSNCVALK